VDSTNFNSPQVERRIIAIRARIIPIPCFRVIGSFNRKDARIIVMSG